MTPAWHPADQAAALREEGGGEEEEAICGRGERIGEKQGEPLDVWGEKKDGESPYRR